MIKKVKKGIDNYIPMGYNKDKIKNGTSRKGEIEMKVINTANQKVLAEVMTNHGMTVEEALELVGIDLSHCDENDGSYKDLDGEDFWIEDCEMIY